MLKMWLRRTNGFSRTLAVADVITLVGAVNVLGGIFGFELPAEVSTPEGLEGITMLLGLALRFLRRGQEDAVGA